MDETTNDLYKKYLSSCQEWIDHIRPIATQMINDYKHLSGKIYYKFDSINTQPYNFTVEINEKEVDENIKSIYKRLALKFHPDKFKHTFNSQLFAIINKHYTLNSINIMTTLDNHFENIVIMDDATMEVVASNLSVDGCWENIEKLLGKSDGDKMYILSTPYKSSKEESSEGNNDFLSTNAYNFFINPTKEKERINKFYYTEAEVINKIKATSDSSFYNYYGTHYIHVKPILQAYTERLLEDRNKLLLENEKLRTRIEALKIS